MSKSPTKTLPNICSWAAKCLIIRPVVLAEAYFKLSLDSKTRPCKHLQYLRNPYVPNAGVWVSKCLRTEPPLQVGLDSTGPQTFLSARQMVLPLVGLNCSGLQMFLSARRFNFQHCTCDPFASLLRMLRAPCRLLFCSFCLLREIWQKNVAYLGLVFWSWCVST